MSGTQFELIVTCAGTIVAMMFAILGLLVKISMGWGTARHEISDLKEDLKNLVDNKFNERLSRIEWYLEDIRAVRNQETAGSGRVAGH